MALVSEVQRTRNGTTFVVARFVLDASGAVVPVELSPRGLALLREAIDYGLPSPTGRGPNVTLAAGRAFLDALPETYRTATPPHTEHHTEPARHRRCRSRKPVRGTRRACRARGGTP